MYYQIIEDKFNSYIFRFTVAFYPYIFLADAIYEFNILGSSFYFMLMLSLMLLLFFYNLIREKSFNSLFFILSISFIYLLFLFTSIIILDTPLSYLKDYRMGIGIIIYIYVIKAVIVNDREKIFVGKIILLNAIALSVFALLHDNYFEHIIVCKASEEPGRIFVNGHIREGLRGMRECSFVFQPTVFATLALMGMFVNIFFLKKSNKKRKYLGFLLNVIFLSAILLSFSRLPIVFAILLTLVHLHILLKNKVIFWFLVSILIISVIATNIDHPLIQRLMKMELGGFRYERYVVGLQTVFDTLRNMLIGTDRFLMTEMRTSGGVKFTDNSFIYLMLYFGVVYAFILIFYSALSLLSRVDITKNLLQLLLVLFIFLELLFTSFIFQDILLLYSFTTLILIGNSYNKIKAPLKVNT